MPRKLRHFGLLVWLIVARLSNHRARADNMAFGTRLKPLSKSLHLFHVPECINCHNKTSFNPPRIHKTESKWDFYNNLKNKVPETNAKLKSKLFHEEPKDNSKRGATFFFTQVEPHRFEYRAMFQHERNNIQNNLFQPFVHDFDAFSKEFPPLPKFPSFSTFQDFFPDHKDPFPHINDFTFPTLSPEIKRAWPPTVDTKPIIPHLDIEKFEEPLIKDIDAVLRHTNYPKIFRFNEERMNIEDFDRQKKLRFYSLEPSDQNELLEPEKVKRDHLLILHGGIFTVKEPPLFSKQHIKKRRKLGGFRSYRQRL